jgi:serine/threonine-protein kinase
MANRLDSDPPRKGPIIAPSARSTRAGKLPRLGPWRAHRLAARARRLRIACLIFGGSAVTLVLLSFWAEASGQALLSRLAPEGRPLGVITIGLSLLVWLGLWRLPPRTERGLDRLTVALGLGGSALIAAIEMSHPWASTSHVMGVSMICLWLLLLPVLSPMSPRRTLAWTISAAALGPAFSLAFGIAGIPQPGAAVVGYFWLPSLLAAGVAGLSAHALRDARREARVLGAYRLEKRLAEGGMGEVWLARHRLLERPAAVKLIKLSAIAPAGGATREILSARFEREAQITARLTSPHAVVLHDFGVAEDDTMYFVMELLRGLTLQQLVVRHGPVPPARAAHFIAQACHALDEAHRLGLIHRDLKPANLFVTRAGADEDVVKVLDFGLSRPMVRGAGEVTITGKVLGTPGYIAPEAALDRVDEIDGRADIYALGCILFFLVTGAEVFAAASPAEVLREHAFSPPPAPSSRAAQAVSPAFDAVVLACLAKEPDARPSSCAALAIKLRELAPAWTAAAARTAWLDAGDDRGAAR